MQIKIAIVDDNSFLIKAVKEKLSFFEDLNFKFSAMNGSELLVKLEDNHNLDLILMDIEMPVLNGIETTELVKQKYPHIKIIMLTVFDNDENIFNAIKAGADGYLLKEINAKDLHDGIIETLNGGAAMNPSIALKTLKLLRNPITIQNKQDQEDIQLTSSSFIGIDMENGEPLEIIMESVSSSKSVRLANIKTRTRILGLN